MPSFSLKIPPLSVLIHHSCHFVEQFWSPLLRVSLLVLLRLPWWPESVHSIYLSWSLGLWRRARCCMVPSLVPKVGGGRSCNVFTPSAGTWQQCSLYVSPHLLETLTKEDRQSCSRWWPQWWDKCFCRKGKYFEEHYDQCVFHSNCL